MKEERIYMNEIEQYEWLIKNTGGNSVINQVTINANQLRIIGMSWPPKKGWMEELLQRGMTETEMTLFEEANGKKKIDAPIVDKSQLKIF